MIPYMSQNRRVDICYLLFCYADIAGIALHFFQAHAMLCDAMRVAELRYVSVRSLYSYT